MPFETDPRYQILGMPHPGMAQEAERFYQSLPDTTFLQARGMTPQTMMPGMQPEGGYVDPYAPGAMIDPMAQTRQYEDTILAGMKGFDVAAPDFSSKLQDYFGNHPDVYATQYPRVQSAIASALESHNNLQKIFQRSPKLRAYYGDIASGMTVDQALPLAEQITINEPKDVTLRGEYHSAINDLLKGKKNVDPEDISAQLAIKHSLAGNGIDPSELMKDGKIDATAAALAIAKSKVGPPVLRPITDGEERSLSKAMEAVDAARDYVPSQPEKKKLIDSGEAKDWDQAYNILKKRETERAQTSIKRRVTSYRDSNIAVPPDYYEAAGMSPEEYSFNAKGKPVRKPGDKTEAPETNRGTTVAPTKTDAPPPTPTVAPQEASIYSAPPEETPESRLAKEQGREKETNKDLQKAVEEAYVTHYKRAGKSVIDAAHDLDRLAIELHSNEATPLQSRQEIIDEFLKSRDIGPNQSTRDALEQIVAQRKDSLSNPKKPEASQSKVTPEQARLREKYNY